VDNRRATGACANTIRNRDETSHESSLAKGRIVDLSQLAAANGFVRSWPYLAHGFLDLQQSPPPPKRNQFIHSAQHVRVTNTHRQTICYVQRL